MPKKVAKFNIKGMQRDLSVSKFNPDFAFENKNMRIAALGDNTMFSLVNEKGTSLCEITWVQNPAMDTGEVDSFVNGVPIGKAVIDKKLILFTHMPNYTGTADEGPDRIYKFWFENDALQGMILKRGDLKFDEKHPIETLTSYESETVQKVYWVDGINQPRVLNVVSENTPAAKIDFLPTFSRTLNVEVERQQNGEGIFNSGTIQYVITYYEKFGQETNAVYVSPIYYISPNDRGGAPDETNTCSFLMQFTGIDITYDYMRIYSVQKSSESGTPLAHIVADVKISGSTFNYTDTGIYNTAIDPTILMYLGGVEITASTIAQKDNTLFLGDLTLTGDAFSENQIDNIKAYFSSKRNASTGLIKPEAGILYFSTKTMNYPKGAGVYLYDNQLKYSSEDITTFKSGEYYRFGVQFMTAKGQWSQVFYVGDIQNTIYPVINTTTGTVTIAKAVFKMDKDLYEELGSNIVSYRLCYAEMSLADHTVIAQGALCPTVFNYKQRSANQPFALSSWFMRPDNDPGFMNWHLYNIQERGLGVNTEIQGFDPTQDEYRFDSKVNENERGDVVAIKTSINVVAEKKSVKWYYTAKCIIYYFDKDGNTIAKKEIKYTNGAGSDGSDPLIVTGGNIPVHAITSGGIKTGHKTVYGTLYSLLCVAYVYNGITIFTKEDLDKELDYGRFQNWFPIVQKTTGKDAYDLTHDIDVILDGQTYATSKNAANYFVDRSIVSFHSPELKTMRDRIDSSPLKFRLIGLANITANASAYEIEAENTTTLLPEGATSLVFDFNHNNMSATSTGLKTFLLWQDGEWTDNSTDKDGTGEWGSAGSKTLYPLYPWQASGSLNGHPDNTGKVEYANKSSVLKSKTIANLRFSNITKYVGNCISSAYDMSITAPHIFDSDNPSITRIAEEIDEKNKEYVYSGNYDYLLMHNEKFPVYHALTATNNPSRDVAAEYLHQINENTETIFPKTIQSIRIKFKSSLHAVFKFNRDGYQDVILPYGVESPTSEGEETGGIINTQLPWDRSRGNFSIYDKIIEDDTWFTDQSYPYVWIGEFYTERDASSWLGGIGDNALESNKWIPAGAPVAIAADSYAYGTSGDTYFQRWDCLKTFPYAEGDENSIIDVTSFMVETYTNIAGRYDKNRGVTTLLYNRPANFDLINRTYTQPADVFNYSVLDEKFNLNVYKNQITWSKTKTPTEDVDTWTNLTLASSLDLDGDKGKITKLDRLDNSLVCFQESGISEIQFNNLTAMSTQEGVPLEIANSGKVNGKNYITTSVGCTNKWSICHGLNGIYFMDDLKRKIIRLSSKGIEYLSDALGFSSWAYQNISGAYNSWIPTDATDFITQYDNNTADVYFINKDTCLAYNENLGQFTSFYSYQGTVFTANLDDKCIALALNRDNQTTDSSVYKPWLLHNGEYNNFFGAYDDFYTTVIVNQDVEADKIFDTLEFRADTWNSDGEFLPHRTFDTLTTWNEYQKGTSNLSFILGRPSSLKHKFRIWRANIPRSDTNKMDRMRNPWLYLKLSMEKPNFNKTVLHDMLVYYFL